MLYRVAKEEGATKIALGHHADDCMETLLLNLFFGPKLNASYSIAKQVAAQTDLIQPTCKRLVEAEVILDKREQAEVRREMDKAIRASRRGSW